MAAKAKIWVFNGEAKLFKCAPLIGGTFTIDLLKLIVCALPPFHRKAADYLLDLFQEWELDFKRKQTEQEKNSSEGTPFSFYMNAQADLIFTPQLDLSFVSTKKDLKEIELEIDEGIELKLGIEILIELKAELQSSTITVGFVIGGKLETSINLAIEEEHLIFCHDGVRADVTFKATITAKWLIIKYKIVDIDAKAELVIEPLTKKLSPYKIPLTKESKAKEWEAKNAQKKTERSKALIQAEKDYEDQRFMGILEQNTAIGFPADWTETHVPYSRDK